MCIVVHIFYNRRLQALCQFCKNITFSNKYLTFLDKKIGSEADSYGIRDHMPLNHVLCQKPGHIRMAYAGAPDGHIRNGNARSPDQ